MCSCAASTILTGLNYMFLPAGQVHLGGGISRAILRFLGRVFWMAESNHLRCFAREVCDLRTFAEYTVQQSDVWLGSCRQFDKTAARDLRGPESKHG